MPAEVQSDVHDGNTQFGGLQDQWNPAELRREMTLNGTVNTLKSQM